MAVAAGATLTLDPGVVVKGNAADSEIAGTLDAQGTRNDQITFTSVDDDTIAGDTNHDGGATPAASGQWTGLNFTSGAYGNLEHVVVHCAGRGFYLSGYGSVCAGITVQAGAALDVHDSDIEWNSGYGVWATPGSFNSVHAEDNWWGAASGPFPYGSGDPIAYHVVYDPWGNPSIVLDVAADPWTGQSLWDGPSLGASGWCGFAADPVNVGTGNYTYEAHDVSIPTRGLPLEVIRTYNSLLAQDSPFGWGCRSPTTSASRPIRRLAARTATPK